MAESQSLSRKFNNWAAVIMAGIALLGVLGNYRTIVASNVVMKEKVDRHEILLNENNLPVIVTNQKNIADDVSEMKDDVKELIKTFNDYVREHK